MRALGRVPGHGRAGADGLVVRVRVDEHDPPGGKVAHGTTVRTAAAHPFPRHDGKRSRDRAGHVTIGDVKSATGSFPEQSAGTRRFTYGAPRAVTVATDGARVVFLRSAGPYDRVDRLWVYDVAEGREREIADPTALLAGDGELPPVEQALRERLRLSAGGIGSYATNPAATVAAFPLGGRLFVADLLAGETSELRTVGPVVDPRPDPSGQRVAYVTDGTLRVLDLSGEDCCSAARTGA